MPIKQSNNPLDPVDLQKLVNEPLAIDHDHFKRRHSMTPPKSIVNSMIDADRVPDDNEYAWIVDACSFAYLRKGEVPFTFANRCKEELLAAGYDNIRVMQVENVAAVIGYYDNRPYVFIRGSEFKAGSRADRRDTRKDWKRNFQFLGWAKRRNMLLHRGITTEAELLYSVGLPKRFDNHGLPCYVGHSKAGGIAAVLAGMNYPSPAIVMSIGALRVFKRGWSVNPWQRPAWVKNYNNRVTTWRISHPADPVPSSPSVLRSCHQGPCVVIKEDRTREFRTERQMVRDRLSYLAEHGGKTALTVATGGWLAALWQIASHAKGMIYGVALKHTLTSYDALKSRRTGEAGVSQSAGELDSHNEQDREQKPPN